MTAKQQERKTCGAWDVAARVTSMVLRPEERVRESRVLLESQAGEGEDVGGRVGREVEGSEGRRQSTQKHSNRSTHLRREEKE